METVAEVLKFSALHLVDDKYCGNIESNTGAIENAGQSMHILDSCSLLLNCTHVSTM